MTSLWSLRQRRFGFIFRIAHDKQSIDCAILVPVDGLENRLPNVIDEWCTNKISKGRTESCHRNQGREHGGRLLADLPGNRAVQWLSARR